MRRSWIYAAFVFASSTLSYLNQSNSRKLCIHDYFKIGKSLMLVTRARVEYIQGVDGFLDYRLAKTSQE